VSLLDRIRGSALKAAEAVANRMGIVLTVPWERKAFPAPTFRTLAMEGLKGNSAVFACGSALIEGYVEPSLLAYEITEDGADPLYDHPLTELLDNPNEDMSGSELLEFIMTYKYISGSCYLYKVRSSGKRVVELWPLSDAQMRPIAGGEKLVDYFEFDYLTGSPVPIVKEDVIHLKWMIDPIKPWMGLGPLAAVLREVCTDNEATAYLYALLKNDAVPRMKLKIPPETKKLTPEEKELIRQEYHQAQGGDNRGKIALLEGGADLEAIALNLKDMEFNALRRIPEARIASVSGVPAVVAGLYVGLEQMTYNNVDGMETHFTERKLVPIWKKDAREITQGLVGEFQTGGRRKIVVQFDTSNVLALQSRMAAKRDFALRGLTSGGMLVNEFREACGYDPDPNGNIYLRGPLMVEVPFGAKTGKAARKRMGPRALKAARNFGIALRRLRILVSEKAAPEIDAYFKQLSSTVVSRLLASKTRKAAPGDLISPEDLAKLQALVKKWAVRLLSESWSVINQSVLIEGEFDESLPFVKAALEALGRRIEGVGEETLKLVNDALEEGAKRGWTIPQMINGDAELGLRGIKDLVEEAYAHRSECISRTELGTVQNDAALGRYEQNGVNEVAVLDGDSVNSCDECKVYANGDVVWTIEQARANPLEHPSCLPGDAVVCAPNMTAGYLRRFDGEVIVLRTSANDLLTCTPNHPILTDRGWLAAQFLQEGDCVFRCNSSEGVATALDPDYHEVPSRVEDVVRAALESGRMVSTVVPGSSEDFHGDGSNGDIDIVFSNGLGQNGEETALGKHGGKGSVDSAGMGLSDLLADSNLLSVLKGLLPTPDGVVGRGGDPLPADFAEAEHLQSVGIAGVPQFEAAFAPHLPQRSPIQANSLGDPVRGISGKVLLEEFVEVDPGNLSTGRAQFKVDLLETPLERGFAIAGTHGDLMKRIASLVSPTHVVHIERRKFSGHVYNLETKQGWYIANNIITHNCVRTFGPVV
jgi:HK97 family phage portal protein